jgi:hypothetical protein
MRKFLFALVLLFPALTWGYYGGYYNYFSEYGGFIVSEPVPGAPVEAYHDEYPSSVVHYDTKQTVEVIPGQPFFITAVDHGEVHHLRYNDGWWYDYDTGSGFPARVE